MPRLILMTQKEIEKPRNGSILSGPSGDIHRTKWKKAPRFDD
jgi:hypothetical protein